MPGIIFKSHSGLVICKQGLGPSSLAAVPTKVAEFLVSWRPIVATQGIGDLHKFLNPTSTRIIIEIEIDFSKQSKQFFDLIPAQRPLNGAKF